MRAVRTRPICPICRDEYTAPRSLPCLHSYCEKCLRDCIRNSVTKDKEKDGFVCPMCRNSTLPPFPNKPVDKWTEQFPYDRILMSMLPDAKKKVDQFCEPCNNAGKSVAATSFCVTCKEALCKACDSVHRNSKLTKNHSFMNIGDINSNPEIAVGLTGLTCPRHTNREIEYFCSSHDSMCCSDCLADDHRGCGKIHKLTEHGDTLVKSKDPKIVLERINKLDSHLDEFTESNESAFKKLETSTRSMADEIDAFKEKIVALLDKAKVRILTERQVLMKGEHLNKEDENKHCQSLKASLKNSQRLLEAVVKYGDNSQIFMTLLKIEDQLEKCEEIIRGKYTDVRQVEAKLKFDSHLTALQQVDECQIAKLDVKVTKLKLNPPVENTGLLRAEGGFRPRQQKAPVTKSSVSTLRVVDEIVTRPPEGGRGSGYSGGMGPLYTGVVCLSDNKLMLVDNYNNLCRVYDRNTHDHLSDYKLPSCPWGICVLESRFEDHRVAVTASGQIHILSINRDGVQSAIKTIKTKLESCLGISALSPDRVVVSGQYNNKICLCIVCVSSGKEKEMFDICEYTGIRTWITVSRDRSHVFVSCLGRRHGDESIFGICVENGDIHFKYKMSEPRGICVDNNENIYIINCVNPGEIHQLTGQGEFLQVIKSGITSNPLEICFDDKNEFYMTRSEKVMRLRLEE